MEVSRLDFRVRMKPTTGIRAAWFLIVLLLPSTSVLVAQDSHYWTNQFGNRARLLGGAVIGSVDDVSAVYYNPGALALVDDVKLALAGRVIEIQNVSIEGFESETGDTNDLRLDLAPALFAGEKLLLEAQTIRDVLEPHR